MFGYFSLKAALAGVYTKSSGVIFKKAIAPTNFGVVDKVVTSPIGKSTHLYLTHSHRNHPLYETKKCLFLLQKYYNVSTYPHAHPLKQMEYQTLRYYLIMRLNLVSIGYVECMFACFDVYSTLGALLLHWSTFILL